MTAKENVLAIYPNAAAIKRDRIALDAKPEQFIIEIVVFPSGEKLASLSTTFYPPEMLEDMVWEQAWITIQQQMLEKLEEDPEDRRWEEQEEEARREQEYSDRLREEERDWEQRLYEDLEEKAQNRRRLQP